MKKCYRYCGDLCYRSSKCDLLKKQNYDDIMLICDKCKIADCTSCYIKDSSECIKHKQKKEKINE